MRPCRSIVGVLTAVVFSPVAGVFLVASPAVAACGGTAVVGGRHGTFTASSVNVRTGPSTTCDILAQGYPGHRLRYECWAIGTPVKDGGVTYVTWSKVVDETVGIAGWVSDAYVSAGGAIYPCAGT